VIKLDREELKSHYHDLITGIQMHHVTEDNIYQELFVDNTPVVGLCHERGYFVIMSDMFIHYSMEHIITDVDLSLIGRRLKEIIVYDNYQEYESDRVKRMSKSKDQTGLNFN
jgi:hypothetical protein